MGAFNWGNPNSPVRIALKWRGPQPALNAPVEIAARQACDIAPLNVHKPSDRTRLEAFIWTDQTARMNTLRAAIVLAQNANISVAQERAGQWISQHLKNKTDQHIKVFYHSVMWQYMPPDEQAFIEKCLKKAGQLNPIAWLRMEPAPQSELYALDDLTLGLYLTIWPEGKTRQLARAHPHGAAIEWLET